MTPPSSTARSGSPRPSSSIVPSQSRKIGSSVRSRRAEEAQAALLRAGVRALVREDDAALVRLGAKRGDEALAPARDSVRADVVLREPPVGRLGVLDEHAVGPPGGEVAGGLLLRVGQRQVDDVVRAAGEVARPAAPA